MLEDLTKDGIQRVKKPYNLVFFIMNIVLAGSGTIASAYFNEVQLQGEPITYERKFSLVTLLIGLLQLTTSWIFIGWVWSIYWGYLIYQRGNQEDLPINNNPLGSEVLVNN
jgi:hypothetical protein